MRIFLDANILFSASVTGSATRKLFDAVVRHSGPPVTNPHVIEEAKRNIELKRHKQLAEFGRLIKRVSISNAFHTSLSAELPPQDIPILSGAIGACCSHLWTSDKKHFGKFFGKTIHDVTVISSITLANILIDLGWKPHSD